ncbi:LytR C-terminal domain-containing protein [Nocardia arizonensis]|uniref:LytR C-terminal domain-containing protein n=1 Tax=Nocardia arizonensis TaxID=1141647 RepID=UPI0006D0441A|nr:LytR C-terminal domain-containing protein [Nocardia arizonensis]
MSYPNPTSGGPPLRALAMVLIALAIVFAGLGAMSLSNSDADSETAAPASSTTTAAAPTATAQRTGAGATATEAVTTTAPTTTTVAPPPPTAPAVNRAVPVRVLNNSLVAGLAARTADQLQGQGWTNVSSGNYAGGTIAKTTVFYGDSPGEREAAMEIAQQIGATAEPKSGGPGDAATGVVVILAGG